MYMFLMITLVMVWLFIVPAILQWLWNMTMPELFGLKVIRYWQSFRLIIIVAILTGGTFIKFTVPSPVPTNIIKYIPDYNEQ